MTPSTGQCSRKRPSLASYFWEACSTPRLTYVHINILPLPLLTLDQGPLLNASYAQIAEQVNLPITTVVLASGYNLLAAGCIGPFVCALSRKYGKRPVYLLSALLDIIGTAVGEAKVSYEYLLAARIIQGFATSAFESLLVATIGDLYFVHQRGSRISAVNFILNAASCLSTIICGLVFSSLGWLWLFHLFQIFLVLQFALMFLFCPETTYLRSRLYDVDITTTNEKQLSELVHAEEAYRSKHAVPALERTETTVTIPKRSFRQDLAVYTGVYHHDSMLKDLIGPFLTLLNPAAAYAILTSGLINTWYVGTAIIISGIFSAAPWNFNAAQTGYVGAGPFVGGALGAILTAVAGDPVIKYLGRRNGGVYEPEFRLVFMSIAGVFCGIGMCLFGYGLARGASAELNAFLFGLEMFGITVAIWSTLSYGLDAFRGLSNEIFIMAMLFKVWFPSLSLSPTVFYMILPREKKRKSKRKKKRH